MPKGQERYTEQLEVVREEESTRSMMKREQDLGLFRKLSVYLRKYLREIQYTYSRNINQFHEFLEIFSKK